MTNAQQVGYGRFAMPRIGLGTWELDGERGEAAIDAALAAGYRHIDTARRYGNEALIGRVLKARRVEREQLFITSKVWWTDLAYDDALRSIGESVARLDCAYLDLALIHWPNPAVPLKDTLAAFARAKAQGLVRHIGVSNFPTALLREALAVSGEPIVANQCEYHPFLDQSAVLDFCRGHDMVFVAYAPLGSGALLRDTRIAGLAQRHGRQPSEIVLQWLAQQPGVAAIPRSSDPGRLALNLGTGDFTLDDEDMRALNALRRPDGRLFDPAWSPAWDV
ncbi:MAG TPA: aldo/keto reductase [Bordetella sp.]